MTATAPRSGVIATLIVVSCHAFLWLVFFLIPILLAPKLEHLFRDAHMPLPRITEEVLTLSNWTQIYSNVLPLYFLPLLAVEGIIYFFLRQVMPSREFNDLTAMRVGDPARQHN